jgi:hypothetical protein
LFHVFNNIHGRLSKSTEDKSVDLTYYPGVN